MRGQSQCSISITPYWELGSTEIERWGHKDGVLIFVLSNSPHFKNRPLIVVREGGLCHLQLSGTRNLLGHQILHEYLPECPDMLHVSRHVGPDGWGSSFSFLFFGCLSKLTLQLMMFQGIGGRKFSFWMGLKFQEQRWPQNMISSGFMRFIVCKTQT